MASVQGMYRVPGRALELSSGTGRSTRLWKAKADPIVQEQSDVLIVVMKPVKAGGAKGNTFRSIPLMNHLGHWRPGTSGK